jgi:hypothetical protein
MTIYTILFNKQNIKLNDAIKWVNNNGYKIYKVNESATQYKIRLNKKLKNKRYITKVLSKTIRLVVTN